MLFAILQKYDFSSKSQRKRARQCTIVCCLRYCKSTIFQANHNIGLRLVLKVELFAILQKYDFSSKSQHWLASGIKSGCCLRYCKSTIFQANHNLNFEQVRNVQLFAILQKYDFSSKSQLIHYSLFKLFSCLRYCKSTIFQANHNTRRTWWWVTCVVCDTAKVRFFKQITTTTMTQRLLPVLFAILQKYDFSSKSQRHNLCTTSRPSCLRYCKSTIFQANHNIQSINLFFNFVVCDTAKVRFFKQITTGVIPTGQSLTLFAILQKYDFSSKSQLPFQE